MKHKYGLQLFEDEEIIIFRTLIFELLFKVFFVCFVMALGVAVLIFGVNLISGMNL